MAEFEDRPIEVGATAALAQLEHVIDVLRRGECYGLVLAWREKEIANYVLDGASLSITLLMDQLNDRLAKAIQGLAEGPRPGESIN